MYMHCSVRRRISHPIAQFCATERTLYVDQHRCQQWRVYEVRCGDGKEKGGRDIASEIMAHFGFACHLL